MPRPPKKRCLRFKPKVTFFKPRGVQLRYLSEINLKKDEVEAIKLHDYDGLSHLDASKKMEVSQPTFGRILNKGYKKIAKAIVEGKALKINE